MPGQSHAVVSIRKEVLEKEEIIEVLLIAAILILNPLLSRSSGGVEQAEDYRGTGENTLSWGFTWHFSWNWVSGEDPNYAVKRVDGRFQEIWENYFKPTHGRIIRNDVNVWKSVEYGENGYELTAYGRRTINRIANLCIWAEENDAYLFLILNGAGDWYPAAFPEELEWQYVHKMGVFVENLADKVLSVNKDAYGRIFSYEIENEMNDVKKGWPDDRQKVVLGYGADAIREGEKEAGVPENIGRYTRLTVNPSYEPYPIGLPSFIGYKYEYAELRGYVKDILDNYYDRQKYAHSNIDIIGLDYYPGSLSYTSENLNYSDLIETAKKLCADFGKESRYGKEIMVVETGYTDLDDASLESEQRNYYRMVSLDAMKFYDSGGKEMGFLGIIWYELFDDPHDHGCWMDTDRRVRNFGIIETADDMGGSGGYGEGERPKKAWKWLANNL